MEINLRLCYIGCRRGEKIYMCNALEELVKSEDQAKEYVEKHW